MLTSHHAVHHTSPGLFNLQLEVRTLGQSPLPLYTWSECFHRADLGLTIPTALSCLLWHSLLSHFGQHVPGGATKYSSTTRWEFCSSSSAQLPSTTLSDLKYRHLQNQKLKVSFSEHSFKGMGGKGQGWEEKTAAYSRVKSHCSKMEDQIMAYHLLISLATL